MPILVLFPIFGYINHGQIRPVLDSCFCMLHTFPGSFNNVNCIYSGFFKHYYYCLYSIYAFFVVTDLFQTFIFNYSIFIQQPKDVNDIAGTDDEVYSKSENITTMTFKWGQTEFIDYFRVVDILSNYYNKWYIATNKSNFPWKKGPKTIHMLERML